MFDAPIAEGANLFIWIVCILGGFVAGLIAIDTYKKPEKDKDSSGEQSGRILLSDSTSVFLLNVFLMKTFVFN